MVLNFYNLREQPFGATPDTRYLFASETHREALASLLYGIKTGRGFIALIAKPGMGKTTLLFRSLSKLKGEAKTVFLFQTISTPLGFLQTLLKDLGEDHVDGGIVELQAKLTEILTEHSQRGEQLIVVIDEAQNLDNSVLELVRMLSNFETSKAKLMQIILSGQPQLAEKLSSPELVQLRQRISIVAHLDPLSTEETIEYVNHRLQIAGYSGRNSLFTSAALRMLAAQSGGIPRNINTICFNALSIGAALKRKSIDVDVIGEVIGDLDLEPLTSALPPDRPVSTRAFREPIRPRFWKITAGLSVAALALFGFTAFGPTIKNHIRSYSQEDREAKTQSSAVVKPLEVKQDVPSVSDEEIGSDVKPLTVVPLPTTTIPSGKRAHAMSKPSVYERHGLRSANHQDEVLVRPGMTFYGICGDIFTTCTTGRVRELRRLNPWLDDSNRVSVGDVLVVPPPTDISEAARPSVTTP